MDAIYWISILLYAVGIYHGVLFYKFLISANGIRKYWRHK